MPISFESNIPELEIRQRTEEIIRLCIGERANKEDWKIWIHTSRDFCRVRIQGPTETRERFFFEEAKALPDAIFAWINAYPFR